MGCSYDGAQLQLLYTNGTAYVSGFGPFVKALLHDVLGFLIEIRSEARP